MNATITSLELRKPWDFFSLSLYALKISRQLKASGCLEFQKKGIWMKHYTMTLWPDEAKMRSFANSGAHLKAIKNSRKIAREIRTLTIDATELPDWKKAEQLLQEGRVIVYR